ncbi:DUF4362 domain-containing protein [Paenibacillus roseipurpureus]|uniref:DUF4362 domain-containing protein n=1 Tax=Paenibacillus roseopurpureus TaxID=2918901 RepID=A0AA96LSZ8_9BACL|nr:DUF4362 domain-containing protein [Paenibacillus sp. MBLB1832]WNR45388.1 DUF4362 domain-containing protein [Paenibacillus sp. MBLB1832]
MLKKLMIFAFAMSILSGCSKIKAIDQPQETLKNNADVVDIHGSVSNLFKMDDFVKKIKEKENVSINISHYTIEGDPIYHNIKYRDGNFELQYDTTQDKFGAGKVTTYSCENFEKTETNTELLKYGDNQANEINTIDMKLVKDLKNGQMLGVSDFQLNNEERQKIYKKWCYPII